MQVPPRVQTEDKAFERDTHSKALLCTDAVALKRHRTKLAKAHEHEQLKREVAELRSTLTTIQETQEKILKLLGG